MGHAGVICVTPSLGCVGVCTSVLCVHLYGVCMCVYL